MVVADDRDHFPDVFAGADQSRAATGGSVGEADQRMFIHPKAFLDVALREGPRRQVHPPGPRAQAGDGRVRKANAQRLTYVVQRSAQ